MTAPQEPTEPTGPTITELLAAVLAMQAPEPETLSGVKPTG